MIGHLMRTEDAQVDLWTLTRAQPQIDPTALSRALEREAADGPLDFRTRLLIRDSIDALEAYWGPDRVANWLGQSASRRILVEIHQSELGPAGFPSLKQRIMDAIEPETVQQFLRELGTHVHHPHRIVIGGAIALILARKLARATEDIDIVDEVPAELRSQHELLDRLLQQYGLHLTHFQSHYLPAGWEQRITSLGRFGQLDVFLVDPIDIFSSKLFSARDKDLGDLRVLARELDKETARRRALSAEGLMANSTLAQQAAKNWYIVFGEELT